MAQITISVDNELLKVMEKRAKSSLMSVNELCDDIVTRSMLSWKNRNVKKEVKTDDKLVNIFSRSRRGRKKKS